jgi:hypothetical protein
VALAASVAEKLWGTVAVFAKLVGALKVFLPGAVIVVDEPAMVAEPAEPPPQPTMGKAQVLASPAMNTRREGGVLELWRRFFMAISFNGFL